MQFQTDSLRERLRWTSCGLIAGLLIGIILGWSFHGVVGTIFRIFVVLLFIVPFIAAIAFWLSNRRSAPDSSPVQEATWRDADDRPGRR